MGINNIKTAKLGTIRSTLKNAVIHLRNLFVCAQYMPAGMPTASAIDSESRLINTCSPTAVR
ncbi:MAG: hypothetical protein RHS_1869 [Robinsoniella sp. RHS]|nr:MAG: hypothetical protein RHS_1869 [Robinsoniella sp. RHS]